MTQSRGALEGEVVACSTAQAGSVPYMLMGTWGEVIKIERRCWRQCEKSRENSRLPSSYFETNNRGVKSLTLNLKPRGGTSSIDS